MPALVWVPVAALSAFGCTGDIDSNATAVPGVPGAVGAPGGPTNSIESGEPTCVTPAVGPSPLRRLTHREYQNALVDLLGPNARPAAELPRDNQVGLFDNTAVEQRVPVLLAENYLNSAVQAADGVQDVGGLLGCVWLVMGNAGGFFKHGQVLKVDGRSCDGPIDALRA